MANFNPYAVAAAAKSAGLSDYETRRLAEMASASPDQSIAGIKAAAEALKGSTQKGGSGDAMKEPANRAVRDIIRQSNASPVPNAENVIVPLAQKYAPRQVGLTPPTQAGLSGPPQVGLTSPNAVKAPPLSANDPRSDRAARGWPAVEDLSGRSVAGQIWDMVPSKTEVGAMVSDAIPSSKEVVAAVTPSLSDLDPLGNRSPTQDSAYWRQQIRERNGGDRIIDPPGTKAPQQDTMDPQADVPVFSVSGSAKPPVPPVSSSNSRVRRNAATAQAVPEMQPRMPGYEADLTAVDAMLGAQPEQDAAASEGGSAGLFGYSPHEISRFGQALLKGSATLMSTPGSFGEGLGKGINEGVDNWQQMSQADQKQEAYDRKAGLEEQATLAQTELAKMRAEQLKKATPDLNDEQRFMLMVQQFMADGMPRSKALSQARDIFRYAKGTYPPAARATDPLADIGGAARPPLSSYPGSGL